MRTGWILLAILLLGARAFTGIVYERDDPTTYFVIKNRPSFTIVQENGPRPVRDAFTIIDGGENELSYQPAYVFVMNWALELALFSLGLGLALRANAARMKRKSLS